MQVRATLIAVLSASCLIACAGPQDVGGTSAGGANANVRESASRDAKSMVAEDWLPMRGARLNGFWFLATHTDHWRITKTSEDPNIDRTAYGQEVFYYNYPTHTVQPYYPSVLSPWDYFSCPAHTQTPVGSACASPVVERSTALKVAGIFFGKQDVAHNDPTKFSHDKIAEMISDIGVDQLLAQAQQVRMRRYEREYGWAQHSPDDARVFLTDFADWDPMNRVPAVRSNIPALQNKVAEDQRNASRAAGKAQEEARERFFRNARVGSQLFCNTGNILLGADAPMDSIGYECSQLGTASLQELAQRGYAVSSMDKEPARGLTGTAYRVSLILTKQR